MRVAITGGSGFIGQYLCQELFESGLTPVILTRKSSGNEKYEVIETNYTFEDLENKLTRIDSLVHLASKRGSQGKILEFHENEVLTQTIFDVCSKLNIKNIVNASTISVYSDQTELPWNENSSIKPDLMYGISKFTNECIANVYSEKYQLNIKNLRIAHVFGFNEKNNYMINKFMRQAYNKKMLQLNVPGEAKREFIYAKDVAKAIKLALHHPKSGTFNIGTGYALTNEEVALSINEVFQNFGMLEILDVSGKEDIKSSYMTSQEALKVLDFTPSYSIEEALEEIYKQMEELEHVPELY